MTSLGFIGAPLKCSSSHTQNHDIIGVHRPPLKCSSSPNLIFCSGPPQLFWSEIFRSPPKIGGGGLLPWLATPPPPQKKSPSLSNPLKKLRSCQGPPPFLKFGWRFNPPSRKGEGGGGVGVHTSTL